MADMELAWLIPAFSFVAFFLIVAVGRFLPLKGAWIAILAIAAGFGVFWLVAIDRIDQGATGIDYFSRKWFDAGGFELAWGMIIDPLS
ncbi:MAG: hypothetical protein FJ320_11545, partial [SAR202 cluster bacterium]|nr:hypothetical protein [SAR202 cluster bacterium]